MIERGSARDVRRYEAYTRSSYYALVPILSLAALASLVPGTTSGTASGTTTALAGLAVLIHSALAIGIARQRLHGRVVPSWLVVLFAGVSTTVCALAVLLSDPADLFRHGASVYSAGPLLVGISAAAAGLLTPTWRQAAWLGVLGGAVLVAGYAAHGVDPWGVLIVAGFVFFVVFACAPMGALTWWMIDLVRTLESARRTDAALAVAEERLRFARDLHDVYGRNLSNIVVKSELAAEFARRGDERAVGEMAAVRGLAQDALAEVRSLVRGYRRTDPRTELAGARSILRSAGARVVDTDIEPGLAVLDEAGRVTAGWVLREAVTNVVRHSEARTVTISCIPDDGEAVLRVANDGVLAAARRREPEPGLESGSGLVGLAERLADIGGSIQFRSVGDDFEVVARIPRQRSGSVDPRLEVT